MGIGVLPPVVQKSARPRRSMAVINAAAIRSAASAAASSGPTETTTSGSPLFGEGSEEAVAPDSLSEVGERSGSCSVIVLTPDAGLVGGAPVGALVRVRLYAQQAMGGSQGVHGDRVGGALFDGQTEQIDVR